MLVAKLGMTMSNMRARERECAREREEGERQSVRREDEFSKENRGYKLKERRSVRRNDNALGLPHTIYIFSF